MNQRQLLAQLKSIENSMDLIDGQEGDYWGEEELCFWCRSKKYNGQVGVVHTKDCAKQQVRDKIKLLKDES